MLIHASQYLLTGALLSIVAVLIPENRLTAADVTTPESKPHSQVESHPAKGMLLIARRGMPDPRFRQTVILLATHDAGGSLGLILNRASTTKLGYLIPRLNDIDKLGHRVYFGGPVGIDSLKYLVRSSDPLEDTLHIMDDLYFGGNRVTLEHMLKVNKPVSEFRIYLGYAGWGPDQLTGELNRHDWHLRKAETEEIFSHQVGSMWHNYIEIYEPAGQLVEQQFPVHQSLKTQFMVSLAAEN